jgi:hypothetical protein
MLLLFFFKKFYSVSGNPVVSPRMGGRGNGFGDVDGYGGLDGSGGTGVNY